MKGIATALAKAQANMGKALKQASNPHFRSKYADLGNVMDACLPALNDAGIALIQPTGEDDHGRYVETILIHGESGESLTCRVPLIVGKNDMQGYGSAVTYARRYGLMAMAGIAPEDDDGNAAAANPPKPQQSQRQDDSDHHHDKKANDMIAALKHHGVGPVTSDRRFQADLAALKAASPETAARVEAEIDTQRKAQSADLGGDNIPYQ